MYYTLGNDLLGAADFLLPEFPESDVIGSVLNMKMKHCVAWFSTSASTYVTIEITTGRTEGVRSQKPCPGLKGKNLQLVIKHQSGSLLKDKDIVNWSKKFKKR